MRRLYCRQLSHFFSDLCLAKHIKGTELSRRSQLFILNSHLWRIKTRQSWIQIGKGEMPMSFWSNGFVLLFILKLRVFDFEFFSWFWFCNLKEKFRWWFGLMFFFLRFGLLLSICEFDFMWEIFFSLMNDRNIDDVFFSFLSMLFLDFANICWQISWC